MGFRGERAPGRPKGAKNKRSSLVEEMAAKYKFDPFDILLMIANNDTTKLGYEDQTTFDIGHRLNAAKEASKYLHAQKRAVEIIAGEDAGIKIVVEDYKKKAE